MEQVHPDDWPLFLDDMDQDTFDQACHESISYLGRIPKGRVFRFGDYQVTAAQLKKSLEDVRGLLSAYPDPAQRNQALKERFILFKSVGSDGQGRVLYTGYYEPMLKGSPVKTDKYAYPLYAVPQNLLTIDLKDFGVKADKRRLKAMVKGKKVVPYHDRDAIDFKNLIKEDAKPLAYVDDPVDSFFLQIQGSGQVEFPDGKRLRLGYAATNGHPYRSIGKYLIDQGLMTMDNMSMQAIRKFLADKPDLLREVLSHNPSYVFFRPLAAEGGPLGCYEAPLTGGRSIATDRRIFPGLALVYITGEIPAAGGGEKALGRFAFNQDTGGAIRGPGRVDLFFGTGDLAGELAGRTKNYGSLFFLAPKGGINMPKAKQK